MYHRFHAPHDCTVLHVTYLSGDTWNVNPIALARVERLFCRNERALLRARLKTGQVIALVPVAAILVASLRLHFLHQPGALDDVAEAGVVLDIGGDGQLPAGLEALHDNRRHPGARAIDRRREPGRA